jgi:electron transfer flavoprotein beta subunit
MLKICVPVKSVYDPNRVVVARDNLIDFSQMQRKLNDADRNAVELAVQLKEKYSCYACGLSVGPSKDALYEAKAMGLDDVYWIRTEYDVHGTVKAKILARVINKIDKFDLIVTGEASIDNYSMQLVPRLAVELGIPFVSRVGKILDLDLQNKILKLIKYGTRHEITYAVKLPAIISVTREINTPRYVPLLRLKQAMSFPIKELSLKDLGLDENELDKYSTFTTLRIEPIIIKRRNIVKIFSDKAIKELINLLKEEGIL